MSGSPFRLWINAKLLTSGSPFALWTSLILLTGGSPFALWITVSVLINAPNLNNYAFQVAQD